MILDCDISLARKFGRAKTTSDGKVFPDSLLKATSRESGPLAFDFPSSETYKKVHLHLHLNNTLTYKERRSLPFFLAGLPADKPPTLLFSVGRMIDAGIVAGLIGVVLETTEDTVLCFALYVEVTLDRVDAATAAIIGI